MAFTRPASAFRQVLGSAEFPYEAGRYILYVSHACPWANGTLQCAALKKLIKNDDPSKDKIEVCVVHPTLQYTDPKRDRLKREEDAKNGVEKDVAEPGRGPVHVGWVFGKPGTALLPIGVMENGKDFGLQLPGTAEQIIEGEVSVAEDVMAAHGCKGMNNTEDLSRFKAKTLRHLYENCKGYVESGNRPTTPLIFDTKTEAIVNNESSEILVAFNGWPCDEETVDLYPANLKDDIHKTIDWVYTINNGVYRCGFASAQKDYNAAAEVLEQRMMEVEEYLAKREGKKFLLDDFTAADIRLFNTLVRMDEVYVCYFKCVFASLLTGRFPHLLRHTARVYHYGKIKECVFMDDIMNHYFTSHAVRNMFAVVPKSVNFLQKLEDMKE